jgi:hypothetical protein
VRVAAKDTNGDGLIDSVFAGQGPGCTAPLIKRFAPLSATAVDFLMESDPNFRDGFFLG